MLTTLIVLQLEVLECSFVEPSLYKIFQPTLISITIAWVRQLGCQNGRGHWTYGSLGASGACLPSSLSGCWLTRKLSAAQWDEVALTGPMCSYYKARMLLAEMNQLLPRQVTSGHTRPNAAPAFETL